MRPFVLCCFFVLVAFVPASAADNDAPPRDHIRAALAVDAEFPTTSDGDELYCRRSLRRFYEARDFAPAWVERGRPTDGARSLAGAVSDAARHGFRPAHYHHDEIDALIPRERSRDRLSNPRVADLDLLLADAFLLLGANLLAGHVNPETIDAEWFASRREGDMVEVLNGALEARDPSGALAELLPAHRGYLRLCRALERYRGYEASGGWEPVGLTRTLRPGDTGDDVLRLRRRLAVTDGIAVADADTVYDAELETAVRAFQERHGLDVDAVVGSGTLAALDVPAGERVGQIVVNLERWRWLPRELGPRYVLVNAADFNLFCVTQPDTQLVSRVVVGRNARRTPVFTGQMGYLVFNPTWEVPRVLAVQDILPIVKKDPGYIDRMGFRVLAGDGENAPAVDPATVDWPSLSKNRFPYRLRQMPGPLNALGRVKFMFPNKHSVYLHDTPARDLFKKAERGFSSGCIRVEMPMELAEWLLSDTAVRRAEIDDILRAELTKTVSLKEKVPVHLLYWTAWVDAAGTVHFRRDIYERDAPLLAALSERPPGD